MIEFWNEDGKHATLLTNNLDLAKQEIIDIYDNRWQIELLFKHLKQNFPLKYFYGESVNAFESQIWVCLIANLLLTVVNRKVKWRWTFSNLVTAVTTSTSSVSLKIRSGPGKESTLNDVWPTQVSWS